MSPIKPINDIIIANKSKYYTKAMNVNFHEETSMINIIGVKWSKIVDYKFKIKR